MVDVRPGPGNAPVMENDCRANQLAIEIPADARLAFTAFQPRLRRLWILSERLHDGS